jgi:hypothetical protein
MNELSAYAVNLSDEELQKTIEARRQVALEHERKRELSNG